MDEKIEMNLFNKSTRYTNCIVEVWENKKRLVKNCKAFSPSGSVVTG